jgi:hypothetical protein
LSADKAVESTLLFAPPPEFAAFAAAPVEEAPSFFPPPQATVERQIAAARLPKKIRFIFTILFLW